MRPERQRVTDRLTEAWNRHDPEGVASCYAQDAVSGEVALAEPLRGRAAIRNATRMYLDAFPDIRLDTQRVFGAGDCVCEEWVVTGTHRGDFLGLAPTGRSIDVALCHVMTLDADGLIKSETIYWDELAVYRQLGSWPALGPLGGLVEGELDAEWG